MIKKFLGIDEDVAREYLRNELAYNLIILKEKLAGKYKEEGKTEEELFSFFKECEANHSGWDLSKALRDKLLEGKCHLCHDISEKTPCQQCAEGHFFRSKD